VHGDRELLLELAARPEVAQLEPNPRVRVVLPPPPYRAAAQLQMQMEDSLPWGIERIHADDVWAMGIQGDGAVVAGNDTGIAWEHEALKEQYRGWDGQQAHHDRNWHDAINDEPIPYDDHGHGTFTLGIAVGEGGEDERIGVAPGARWIGCKNMDGAGVGSPASYIECFEFFLAPYPHGGDPMTDGDPALAPDVVNNSWYCPPAEGCGPDTLQAAVETLRAAGIVVVTSAGNSGPACSSVKDPPEIYDAAFSVGAFAQGDTIANFSSRGPVTVDGSGRLKPDVAAPGVGVRSCAHNGGYSYGNGTSMAAPHVAGAAALLWSWRPDFSNIQVEQRLESQADDVNAQSNPGHDPYIGWGRLNIHRALSGLAPSPTQTPTPTATATPTPIPTITATVTPSPTGTSTPTIYIYRLLPIHKNYTP